MKVKWYRKDGRTMMANDAPGAAEALRKDGWRLTPPDKWDDKDVVVGNELNATTKALVNEKTTTQKLTSDVTKLTSMFGEMSTANDGLIDENNLLRDQLNVADKELKDQLLTAKTLGGEVTNLREMVDEASATNDNLAEGHKALTAQIVELTSQVEELTKPTKSSTKGK